MYSLQDIELNENTKCVKVAGDKFPEIHWEPSSDYWACNVKATSSEDQVSQSPEKAYQGSSIEQSSLESNSNYPSTSSQHGQQISQFNQHATNGNSTSQYTNGWNVTRGCQQSLQTHTDLKLGNGGSLIPPNYNHTSTPSPVTQNQIPHCNQYTPNRHLILPNNSVVNRAQFVQGYQIPLRSTLSIQSSYHTNRPRVMLPYTVPRHANSFSPGSYQFNQHPNVPGKSHLTNMSYVKTPSGALRTNGKLKRKRTMFTTEQVAVLENVFFKKAYVTREDRLALVDKLHVNEKTIKVWFQNRRLKDKREAAELEDEIYTPESPYNASIEETSSYRRFDRLFYVEYLMNQPDERGFVTLDDKALSDLAAVIDDILPKDIQLDDVKNTQQTEIVCARKCSTTMYEPISPAEISSSDNDESFMTQELLEPKETLQRLFDLQTILNLDCTS